jgi:hypothetical protein
MAQSGRYHLELREIVNLGEEGTSAIKSPHVDLLKRKGARSKLLESRTFKTVLPLLQVTKKFVLTNFFVKKFVNTNFFVT